MEASQRSEDAGARVPAHRRFGVWLAAITLVGVVIRVVYTLREAPWPPGGLGDQVFYELGSYNLARGLGFIDPFKLLSDGSHVASVGHPPFYVVALAGVIKVFGSSDDARRLAGSAFGAVTIVTLALVARRLAGDRAGLLAAAIAATYPMLITTDGALMSETLMAALLGLALVSAYRLLDTGGMWWAVAFGVSIGLAALTRGDALLLIPLILLAIVRRPGGWRAAAVACVTVAVVLTPWTVRNESVFHEFLPISSDTTVAGANCHDTYYGKDVGYWNLYCIKTYPGADEAHGVSMAEHAALVYASHHIVRLPVVVAARLQRTWVSIPGDMSNLEGRAPRAVWVGYGEYYLLLGLSVFGFILLRRRREAVWIIVTPIVAVFITTVLVYGGVRFRVPAELSFVVLSAVALDELWTRVAARRARRNPAPADHLDLAAQAGD